MSHSQTESRSTSQPVRTVTTASGDITYSAAGSGPAAVFVHGVFLSHRFWDGQLAGLADTRRCLAPDLLAHGGSDIRPAGGGALDLLAQAQMIVDFMDALGLAEADLVGNDTGGAITQMVAANTPGRVRSLTLTNCDTHDNWPPPPFQPVIDLARQGALAPALPALATDAAQVRGALGGSFEHPDQIPDEVLLAFTAPFTDPERAAALQDYLAGMDNAVTVAIRDKLARFQAPTQMVWGTADKFFSMAWAQWLADTIPGTRRVVPVEGALLFFPLERPGDLNRALREFWTAR
jgi:pimeloyl-ACP methyl ester carboxylesterase